MSLFHYHPPMSKEAYFYGGKFILSVYTIQMKLLLPKKLIILFELPVQKDMFSVTMADDSLCVVSSSAVLDSKGTLIRRILYY